MAFTVKRVNHFFVSKNYPESKYDDSYKTYGNGYGSNEVALYNKTYVLVNEISKIFSSFCSLLASVPKSKTIN